MNNRFAPSFWVWAGLLAVLLGACVSNAQVSSPPTATVAPTPSATPTIVWFPSTATPTPYPTFQPSPTPNPLPGLGNTLYSDDFSQPLEWTNARQQSAGSSNVLMSGNRLILAANVAPVNLSTLRQGLVLNDFYAESNVTLNRCGARDAYGMYFRAATEAYAYRFTLTCEGRMRVERARGGEVYPLSDWETSGDLPPGAPAQFKIGIWTAGNEMRFFLNDRYQFTVLDSVFRNGSVGYFAVIRSEVGLNVSFSSLQIRAVSYVSPTPTPTPSRTPTPTRTPR
ncbi:MAG: hypothetical protein NZP74_03840 [Anaerolineales bacterium]|nr:hypothetical protein [Anaerolineales bacterium]MDW8278486.1 hypothetical protein [Anaerolineales bacterium]